MVKLETLHDVSCDSGVASPTIDPQGLAEVMPPSAAAFQGIVPPVQTIAEDTPFTVPAAFASTVGLVPINQPPSCYCLGFCNAALTSKDVPMRNTCYTCGQRQACHSPT